MIHIKVFQRFKGYDKNQEPTKLYLELVLVIM